MHGTVGSGKSTLMRKFLDQCRQRGIWSSFMTRAVPLSKSITRKGAISSSTPGYALRQLGYVGRVPNPARSRSRSHHPHPDGFLGRPLWQGSARTIFAEGHTACAAKKAAATTCSCAPSWPSPSTSCASFWPAHPPPTWLMARLKDRHLHSKRVNQLRQGDALPATSSAGASPLPFVSGCKTPAMMATTAGSLSPPTRSTTNRLKPLISMGSVLPPTACSRWEKPLPARLVLL